MLKSRLFSLLNFSTIAFLRAGVPSTAVYFVSPPLMALIAASFILSGVSKSGSLPPKPITSLPPALSSLAFCVTAIVGDGLISLNCLILCSLKYKLILLRCLIYGKYLSRFNY